ncbi:MAG: adenylate/guanylate cyclase domain-containing protein [Thermodesulfobacteriota bacterium]
MNKLADFFSKAVTPSIGAKLALIITAVVMGGMGLLSLFILGNQSSILASQADAYASALGSQLSIAAVEPLLAGDTEAMGQLTSNLTRNEGIAGIAIYSDQAQLLSAVGENPEGTPDLLSPDQPLSWFSGIDKKHEFSSYMVKIDFQELTVGYSILTFDHSFMSAAYTSTLKTISIITALMLTLGVVVSVLLSKRLSRPVRQLVDGTEKISDGDYRFRFHEYRRDELGQLMRSLNTMTEGLLKKEQVEKTFSRYVSPGVASTLMDDPKTNDLGGRYVEATVLFADIVGFSTLSEKLEPEDINTLLNDYFTVIDGVAGQHKGHIDKFIGDCAMILFGVPEQDSKHGIHAVNCGAEIQQVIEAYNRLRQNQGKICVEFSVAINSGTMLAGNIGSDSRMEYTVIGDAVNLAARLSSIAKAGQILLTRELHDDLQLDGHYKTGVVQTVMLRGKSEPVEVWQVESSAVQSEASPPATSQVSPLVH